MTGILIGFAVLSVIGIAAVYFLEKIENQLTESIDAIKSLQTLS